MPVRMSDRTMWSFIDVLGQWPHAKSVPSTTTSSEMSCLGWANSLSEATREMRGKKTTPTNRNKEISSSYVYLPVVPHKAVAEVSKIGNL